MMHNLDTPKEQSWMSWFFRGLLFLGMFILLARLTELQVIKGEYYRNLAEGNRIRRVPIAAPRGKILDRNGVVLVENVAVEKTAKFEPLEGYSKVLADETTPEDEVIIEYDRRYIYGPDFGHVTGYLGEASRDEVDKVVAECGEKGPRRLGSFVGRGGLEQFYDCTLRGIAGEELVEVDTRGARVRTFGRRQAIEGEDITVSIDYKLQRKVADAMAGQPGGVVVSTPQGEVLAFYSSPSFDPNIFVEKGSSQAERISQLLSDSSLPMFNRVLGGTYHPGSVYKIVTTVAAVEEGKIDRQFMYDDRGIIKIDEFEFRNWYYTQYGGMEGMVDAVRAMARSTDTFYYEVGAMIGAEKLSDWSKMFGLSRKSGIDLPGEVAGLVPSPEWKRATRGERWYLGNTYHMSIGQGDLATTVAATHRLAMVVANNGELCDLRLVGQGACEKMNVSDEAWDLVRDGLKAACDPGGTGVPFFEFEPDVACKTGTAETSVKGENHAWFSVYGPVEDPEVVVTVLVEKGGEGSKVAAPVARAIMDFIFHP